jgi:cobalt-zinc-cadmium efflux system membrane fusion protein
LGPEFVIHGKLTILVGHEMPRLMTTEVRTAKREVSLQCCTATLLLPGLLIMGACNGLQKSLKAGDGTEIVHQGNRVIVPDKNPLASRLKVEPVVLTTVQRQVTAPASVEADPARYARILPPLSGRVLRLIVHPGDSVKEGQELLTLNAPDFVGAQADYSRARSILAQAEHSLVRQKDLAAHGIVGQKDIDQATADRDSALSDFNRAKDRLRLLGMDPDKTELGAPLIVRSPLSGKVLEVTTAPGEFRNDPNAPLMTVADLSIVWVTANVQEKDIHYVHNGDLAIATFAAYPNETFRGKVLFVADVLDPDTRTAKVRVAFNNEDGRLRPAMFATVVLKTWDTKELTVPTDSLVMAGDRTTVFIEVGKSTFEQRQVQTGEQQGDRTIIKSGLQVGERVLAREGALLQ